MPSIEIQRIRDDNIQGYGVVKVWQQLHRERINVARSTVQGLMRQLGLQGVRRRGQVIRTRFPDGQLIWLLGKVNRQLHASRPNELEVSAFTYVSTWQGWFYVAFVINDFARRIAGSRVSNNMKTEFVLDALEQALYAQPGHADNLIHLSDRGSQYVVIRYTERHAVARVKPSVGSKGDSYDNALAETIDGLYKAELIHRQS